LRFGVWDAVSRFYWSEALPLPHGWMSARLRTMVSTTSSVRRISGLKVWLVGLCFIRKGAAPFPLGSHSPALARPQSFWLVAQPSKSAAHRDKSREWNVSKKHGTSVHLSDSGIPARRKTQALATFSARPCSLNARGLQMPSSRPWKMIRYFHSTVWNPGRLIPPATYGVTSGPPQVDHSQNAAQMRFE